LSKKSAPSDGRYREIFVKAFGQEAVEQFNQTAHQLTRSVYQAYHTLSAAHEDFLRPYDLSVSKYRLLLWLFACDRANFEDGMLPSMLSKFHGISPNTTSSLIAGLEAQGLLVREKHATDNRKMLLRITPTGQALVEETHKGYQDYTSELVSDLSAEERQILVTLLEKLSASMKGRGCP
jgi:DNA-binding MarR family transcriptional regulator